jgi:hypothetical protein
MRKKINSGQITRREFISTTAAGSAFIAAGPVSGFFSDGDQKSEAWPKDAAKYRFHMIGHGHIDPVWLWAWAEGTDLPHTDEL